MESGKILQHIRSRSSLCRLEFRVVIHRLRNETPQCFPPSRTGHCIARSWGTCVDCSRRRLRTGHLGHVFAESFPLKLIQVILPLHGTWAMLQTFVLDDIDLTVCPIPLRIFGFGQSISQGIKVCDELLRGTSALQGFLIRLFYFRDKRIVLDFSLVSLVSKLVIEVVGGCPAALGFLCGGFLSSCLWTNWSLEGVSKK